MKQWQFFPMLVKEEILKNMKVSDRLSLSKYCKTSRSLLGGIANHLNTAKIVEGFFVVDDHLITREVFCSLINRPNSSIRKLGLFVESTADRSTLNEIFGERKLWKVKILEIRFRAEFSESCKELIELCDPSILKTIVIPRLCTNEVYGSIVNTEQWKNCKKVRLNTDSSARHSSSLQVNYDHFSHFRRYTIGVDSLSLEDAWRLIQEYQAFNKLARFHVTTRQRFQDQGILNRIDEEAMHLRLRDYVRALSVPAMMGGYCLYIQSLQFSFFGKIQTLFQNVGVRNVEEPL
ncbi:unnamed protein product [Caenorhabditis brenneri]